MRAEREMDATDNRETKKEKGSGMYVCIGE